MSKSNETTTSFKADIQELKTSIQEAKRQIALANSEFKAISSSMDNWSKSTDGLQAKLNQLEKNLDSQNQIYKSIENELELTKKEYGEDSKAAQELTVSLNNQMAVINGVQKEIEKYSSELKNMENVEITAVKSGRNLDDVLNDVNKTTEDTSGGFTVMKGALADLVSDGIKSVCSALKDLVTDSSSAYAQFSASTGVATDAMGEYEEAIKNIYKDNFGESLSDVAEKMAKVKEVTGELDASKLQDMTEKALTLEDTFGMDMTETLRGVQSLMEHFGLSADEAFDYISSGAQNGLNYTDELGDNLSEYSGKFAEAGYSAEEYFQLLQNGSDGGAYNLDKVNDAINEVTARLADGTIEDGLASFSQATQDTFKAWQDGDATQKDVIDSIVKDIQDTTGEQEKMNMAALAFGTMAEDGGTKFISSLTAVGTTYDDVQGKADKLAETKYDTPAAAISGVGRSLKTDLLEPLSEKLLPYIQELADWASENLPEIEAELEPVVDKIGEFISWIADNKDVVIAALAGIAAGLIALDVANMIMGLVKAFQAYKAANEGATVAQWLLNAALSANPIGIVIAVIVGLVAAIVVLWNKSDSFREFWIGVWDKIKSVAAAVGDFLTDIFTVKIPAAIQTVRDWFSNLGDKIGSFVTFVIDGITSLPKKIKEKLDDAIDKVKNFASDMKEKAKEAAKNLFDNVVDGITSLPDKLKSIGSDVVKGLWNGINDMTSWIKDKISGFGDSVVKGLKDFFKIGSPSRLMAKEIGQYLPSGIAVGVEANKDSLLSTMKDLTTDAVVSAKNGLSNVSGSLGTTSAGVVNNFYQTNNSPKALSRLEIYRQSKNLLGYAGGN